jgi:alanyl-tRNA synthetase
MTGNQVRQKYLEFFKRQGHAEIPAAPLVPPNDPTTLFTSSGMQQLVPNLKGEPHSMGTRLVDSQPCFRSEDIDEVGDNRHTTFFEMLGNWSLGDYFKSEQLHWVFEFLTKEIGLDPDRLFVTVFEGNEIVPKDTESIKIWHELFHLSKPDGKIFSYPAKKNWWSRAGVPENMPVGEVGGPDSEIFYDFGEELKIHQQSLYKDQHCHVNCDCGRYLEIGNSVFTQYVKTESGFVPLPKQNVDFGGGLERITAASQNTPDVFTTELFAPIIKVVESITGKSYQESVNQPPLRVIADHLKAATFLIAGGVVPGNKMQGYYLRRLLRRAMVKMQRLHGEISQAVDPAVYEKVVESVIKTYTPIYFNHHSDVATIYSCIKDECQRFSQSLRRGLKIIHETTEASIDGKFAFDLFQSYGFPLEITQELVIERGISINKADFQAEFKKHQELSRTASAGLFKGGLADHSDTIVKYHTATHLLHAALRKVLGTHVQQMGSNITSERLRFDFKHPQKLSEEEKKAIIDLVNQKITENLPVHKTIQPKELALKSGAMSFFREKYPDQVTVYTIGENEHEGWFSKELCGGPHVASTGMIGPVTIKKEEAVGAGIRRLYLMLAPS